MSDIRNSGMLATAGQAQARKAGELEQLNNRLEHMLAVISDTRMRFTQVEETIFGPPPPPAGGASPNTLAPSHKLAVLSQVIDRIEGQLDIINSTLSHLESL